MTKKVEYVIQDKLQGKWYDYKTLTDSLKKVKNIKGIFEMSNPETRFRIVKRTTEITEEIIK